MFLGFFSPKDVFVGLDIGNYYMKVIIANSDWQDIKNLKSAKVEFCTKVRVDNISNEEELKGHLENLFSSYKASKKNVKVIACISSPNVIVRNIEVPQKVNLNKEGMEIARNYIPYKIEEAKYELVTLSEEIPELPDKKEVLLISFLLEDVVKLNDIITSAGLIRVATEFDELGVWRVLEGISYQNFRNTNNIVIDLGHLTTKIMVFNNAKLKQLRNIRLGAEEIKKRILEKGGVDMISEDDWSKVSFKDQKYSAILNKTFEPIIKEIKRTIASYKSKFEFNNLYTIGGLSYIDGINNYISGEVNLKAQYIDVNNFSGVIKIDKKIESEFKRDFNIYLNALGLALGHGQQKFVNK